VGSEADQIVPVQTSRRSVFVPYWSVDSLEESDAVQYDQLMYFGIGADGEGIITTDSGYKNNQSFIDQVPSEKAYITLRMLDTDTNLEILDDVASQERISEDLIEFMAENNYQGVVLDLEISALPFTDVEEQITEFVTLLSQDVQGEGYSFGMTIYGDTFYRARPYNLAKLNPLVDEFFIMSYDFHKSRGEPGPNFPLKGKATYGYDFAEMINDFKQEVDTNKLTIIYGMYGYDWTLGPQGKPLKQAIAKSVSDIQKEFYPCTYDSCAIQKDDESGETQITYKDDEGYNHVLWYESEESVSLKEAYANAQGVEGKSYWAFGYW
jgi:spore germination protein